MLLRGESRKELRNFVRNIGFPWRKKNTQLQTTAKKNKEVVNFEFVIFIICSLHSEVLSCQNIRPLLLPVFLRIVVSIFLSNLPIGKFRLGVWRACGRRVAGLQDKSIDPQPLFLFHLSFYKFARRAVCEQHLTGEKNEVQVTKEGRSLITVVE